MERPYKGRAIIHDNFTEMQIVIPAKKNWFVTIFLGAWLCGWLMGELFALGAVTGVLGGNFGGFFILFWLILWTIGGFFAFRSFLWNLIGKEIITVGQGQLTIDRKGILFFKPRVYDLNEVKNIRAQDSISYGGLGRGSNNFGTFNLKHTLRFDYGLKTIEFAGDIDEAEAKFILDKLKERRLLTEKNFS